MVVDAGKIEEISDSIMSSYEEICDCQNYKVYLTENYALITLIAMRDEAVINAVNEEKQYLKQRLSIPQILFVYPMLFMPLYDINLGDVIDKIIKMVYRYLPLNHAIKTAALIIKEVKDWSGPYRCLSASVLWLNISA